MKAGRDGVAGEVLSGALTGVPIGSQGDPSHRGALIIMLAPTAFGLESQHFATAVREFLQHVDRTRAA